MAMDEARQALFQKVRPRWCTTQAHWTLERVYPDGNALLQTNRGRTRVERVSELELTGGSVQRMKDRSRYCPVCFARCRDDQRLARHLRRVHPRES
jgi:hypothetical protein